MSSNPKPNRRISIHDSKGAIGIRDSAGPKCLDFFKLKGWVRSCQEQNGSIEKRSGAICSNISSNHWPIINHITMIYQYRFEIFQKIWNALNYS
jgi:hypothetical protein